MTDGSDRHLLVIDAATVAAAVPLHDWIEVVAQSLRAVAVGEVVQDVRQILPLPDTADRGRVLSMMFGARIDPPAFGAKVIAVFPDNFAHGLDSHRGAVLLFDPERGGLRAVLHGGEITAARTAAASAVATRALARANSHTLALLGYGEQAERHVAAMCAVRPIKTLRVWGRDRAKAGDFATRMAARHAITAQAAIDVPGAVAGADIVCTTTGAKTPILAGSLLEPGMHCNVVGSSTADYREIDTEAVARASIWVDYRAMTDISAGEILLAIAEGAIGHDHVVGEIGATLDRRLRGRRDDGEVTMFKSLGMPAEDLYAGAMIEAAVRARGLGTRVSF